MNRILNEMYTRRFCLPIDTDISAYESGELSINPCLCGGFNHVACMFKGKDR
jgi:hypothetical protein